MMSSMERTRGAGAVGKLALGQSSQRACGRLAVYAVFSDGARRTQFPHSGGADRPDAKNGRRRAFAGWRKSTVSTFQKPTRCISTRTKLLASSTGAPGSARCLANKGRREEKRSRNTVTGMLDSSVPANWMICWTLRHPRKNWGKPVLSDLKEGKGYAAADLRYGERASRSAERWSGCWKKKEFQTVRPGDDRIGWCRTPARWSSPRSLAHEYANRRETLPETIAGRRW